MGALANVSFYSICSFCIGTVILVRLLKLINNSSCLNKGNHDRDGVWISDLN